MSLTRSLASLRPSPVLLALTSLLGGCGGGGSGAGPGATAPTTEVRNLELAVVEVESQPGFLALTVFEPEQGVDLNGDGDARDTVLHVFDPAADVMRNLGVAVSGFESQPRGVACAVSEVFQDQDLNRDGDRLDWVAHFYDHRDGTLHNLGLASDPRLVLGVDELMFLVDERAQAATDLNFDGDAADLVAHTFDVDRRQVVNLERATWSGGLAYGSVTSATPWGVFLFAVSEAAQGEDLNGDGDRLDAIAHLYRPEPGTVQNFELDWARPGEASIEAGLVAFGVRSGNRIVPHVHDLSDGRLLNTLGRTALAPFVVGPRHVGFMAEGVVALSELMIYDVTRELLTGTGLFGQVTPMGDGRCVVMTREDLDLNGDGDSGDLVAQIYEADFGSVQNLGIAASSAATLDPGGFSFFVREVGEGRDLNGDGDLDDLVWMRYDDPRGVLQEPAAAIVYLGRVGEDEHGVVINEDREDLNGDGDLLDLVLQLHDPERGVTRNLGLGLAIGAPGTNATGAPLSTAPPTMPLPIIVSESQQGGTDLNGDGDRLDRVLHVIVP